MSDLQVKELLCYCKNKFDVATTKQLKIVLCSFYSEDELCESKQILHEAASKVIENFPRLVKRVKSDARCRLVTDDLVEYLTRIDEECGWDKLPTKVA